MHHDFRMRKVYTYDLVYSKLFRKEDLSNFLAIAFQSYAHVCANRLYLATLFELKR